MSAVTITGRVVDSPRFSSSDRPHRPVVRTAFDIEGRHSGARVRLAAENELAERIVATLVGGDLITASCWAKDPEWTNAAGEQHSGRILFVDSFTVHPEPV